MMFKPKSPSPSPKSEPSPALNPNKSIFCFEIQKATCLGLLYILRKHFFPKFCIHRLVPVDTSLVHVILFNCQFKDT